ncbi:MAG TPA: hypothetical protein VKP78_12090 [bacterium]|nr:hypothetical protein [bacterium]
MVTKSIKSLSLIGLAIILVNCSQTPRYTIENINELPESSEPYVVRSHNVDRDVQLIKSKGFEVIERTQRETRVSLLVDRAKKIGADLILYQSASEIENKEDRPEPFYKRSGSKTKSVNSEIEAENRDGNASLYFRATSSSCYSDKFAKLAAFLTKARP